MRAVSQNVVKVIKEKKIRPYPRWIYECRSGFHASLFILSLFLGAISVGFLMHYLLNYYQQLAASFLLFWILFFLIFATVGCLNFRFTKKGYFFRKRELLLFIAFFSLLVGVGIYIFGLGNLVYEILI